MDAINVQVKLTGLFAQAFEKFKDRPCVGESRKNTVAVQEMIRTTPEWKELSRLSKNSN